MKTKLFLTLTTLLLAMSGPATFAAEADNSVVRNEAMPIITAVQEKLKAGKTTEADLADNIKQLDALIAKHKGDKTGGAGELSLLKASLYLQVIENSTKGAEILAQIKRDYPGTKSAEMADKLLARAKAEAEAEKIQNALAVGTKFPDFAEKDLAGKPLAIANYKGKVVMIDFWATWCGPCVGELPNVQNVYKKHHGEGFEIIGVSLDSDRQKLEGFLKQENMPWQQFFDGQGWSNKLAVKYGIHSIPATYLLDGEGKIIGKGLRGAALETAVAKALAKK